MRSLESCRRVWVRSSGRSPTATAHITLEGIPISRPYAISPHSQDCSHATSLKGKQGDDDEERGKRRSRTVPPRIGSRGRHGSKVCALRLPGSTHDQCKPGEDRRDVYGG